MQLDLPSLLLIALTISLVLTVALTKVIYHYDISVNYMNADGGEMKQLFICSFEKEIPWTVLKDAASAFLSQLDESYVPGSEVIMGSNRVTLKRVFHPFWKDSAVVVQDLLNKNQI